MKPLAQMGYEGQEWFARAALPAIPSRRNKKFRRERIRPSGLLKQNYGLLSARMFFPHIKFNRPAAESGEPDRR
ncbi:MAG: hypothetical protein V1928_00265 [Parcubacteria group bacterium]